MGSRGKTEIVLCGPSGRWHLTRLDKEESRSNAAFTKLRRGDLVYLSSLPSRAFKHDGDLKIAKADAVEKIG